MPIPKNKNLRNTLNINDDLFLSALGEFLRKMRKSAGFSTIRSFVDTIDMSYSQYQGYEKGKNITIITLRKIFFEFNLTDEDWLKIDITNSQRDDSVIIEEMHKARIDQLVEQVKLVDDINVANNINSKEAQRLIAILIFCTKSKSRMEILKDLLGMDDSTNTFKRVAGKLLDYGWLEQTDKENRNNPNQKYFTTQKGKQALRLS